MSDPEYIHRALKRILSLIEQEVEMMPPGYYRYWTEVDIEVLKRVSIANLFRHRAEKRDASEGRPDKSVSETLRELPLPRLYREAIARPERTWAGFARADNLPKKT